MQIKTYKLYQILFQIILMFKIINKKKKKKKKVVK